MNCVTRRNLLRNLGAVETTFLEDDVYAEIICDGIHLPPELLKLIIKLKGTDKLCMITDSMRAAGMPDGSYSLGGLPVVVKDGAAKLKDSGALAGSTLQMATAFKNIIEVTGLAPAEAVKSTSLSAAMSLNMNSIGRIAPGYIADMVLLDDNFKVLWTMVDGTIRYKR
jgi:N-acetylglucosamine-6-phosphate deacetylase